jgi:hypothetical protein
MSTGSGGGAQSAMAHCYDLHGDDRTRVPHLHVWAGQPAADDTRPDLAPPPSAAALRSYMRATGWHEGPHGTAGSLWSKNAAGFAVPHDDGESVLRGVISRLAAAEGRTLEETAAAIAAYRDARAATKPCGCGPLEPCGPHLGRGSVASVSAPAVTSPAPASAGRSGTATGPAEGDWKERVERAEAKLAAISVRMAPIPGHGSYGIAEQARAEEILAIIGTGEEQS